MNVTPLSLHDVDAIAPRDEHFDRLLAQLERIDLTLQRAVHALQLRDEDKHDMQALVVSPDELEALVLQPRGCPRWVWAPDAPGAAFAPVVPDDPRSRLGQLCARFELTAFERDVLLLSVLPLVDRRYGILIAYLQDDEQKSLPGLDFALTLLCSQIRERVVQQTRFAPDTTLFREGLVSLRGKNGRPANGREGALLDVDARVFHYLLGVDYLPPLLQHCAQWIAPNTDLSGLFATLTERLVHLCTSVPAQQVPVVLLRGTPGCGRRMAIANAAATEGHQALCVNLELLPENDQDALEVLMLALREVRLLDAWLVMEAIDVLAAPRAWLKAQLSKRLQAHPGPLLCVVEPRTPLVWFGQRAQVLLDMPVRELADDVRVVRAQLERQPWSQATLAGKSAGKSAGKRAVLDSGLDLEALVKRFHISPDTLSHTLSEANFYRLQRSPGATLCNADLYAAFGLRSQQNFGKLARRIVPMRTFSDLVVNDELMEQLREILAAIKHRDAVLAQGFARKVGYGTGISALFYGDSGTGKTMAAEVLAGALGVDLIKVDLSAVVNKYIGETEKHLGKIFDMASADSGVLFFDEADALFGKRSETKDAHDRHANIEVSYLLERFETFAGLVVLATNNRSHLDEAFSRRLTFATRFPFPDVALRERMWREIWPAQVKLDPQVNCAQLAARADLSGANIRNVALLAAWLAAEEGAAQVGRAHIDQALRRELSKIGRIALRA